MRVLAPVHLKPFKADLAAVKDHSDHMDHLDQPVQSVDTGALPPSPTGGRRRTA